MYAASFALFINLKHLDIDIHNTYCYSQSLLCDLPSTTCYSSSIVYLRIKVNTFDDCLYLLDGRLSQLHTFIVKVDSICDASMIINNTVKRSIDIRKNNSFIPVSIRIVGIIISRNSSQKDVSIQKEI